MAVIEVCMGSSCFARGNGENLRLIQEYLERRKLKASVETVGHLCAENCSEGPNIIIDGRRHTRVEASAIGALLAEMGQEDRR